MISFCEFQLLFFLRLTSITSFSIWNYIVVCCTPRQREVPGWIPFKIPLLWLIQQWSPIVFFCYLRCLAVQSDKSQTQLISLTGGNWQKWKRVFLTCPCHEIYRDGAVGLKSCKNTWKLTIFVKMWNLGQNRENLIFCQ